MSGHGRGRAWGAVGLLAGALAAAGCGKTADGDHRVCDREAWPPGVTAGDRLAVKGPLDHQAANGAVVYATLFNYHFDLDTKEPVLDKDGLPVSFRFAANPRPTARLTPWGKELLNRLARHADGTNLDVYVQTAADLVNAPDGPAALGKARNELTAKRVRAVRDYLGAVRPDLAVAVGVTDPDTVGMSGREGRTGYTAMLRGQPGFLSPAAVLGAEIGAAGAAGIPLPSPPPPVDVPSDGGGAIGGLGGSGM